MSKMITYLPLFMRKSSIYNEIFNSEEQQIVYAQNNLEDIKKQLNIDTATWGLQIYENELGIKTDLSKPLDYRRSVVKAKLRGIGKVDRILIKITAEAYSNGEVDVFFNGKIVIKFVGTIGLPPNLEDLKETMEDIKPAHLGIIYEFIYNTHQYLSQFTHQQLGLYTNEQLRNQLINI